MSSCIFSSVLLVEWQLNIAHILWCMRLVVTNTTSITYFPVITAISHNHVKSLYLIFCQTSFLVLLFYNLQTILCHVMFSCPLDQNCDLTSGMHDEKVYCIGRRKPVRLVCIDVSWWFKTIQHLDVPLLCFLARINVYLLTESLSWQRNVKAKIALTCTIFLPSSASWTRHYRSAHWWDVATHLPQRSTVIIIVQR